MAINLTDYFAAIGSKPNGKTNEEFSYEGVEYGPMLSHYEKQAKFIDQQPTQIDDLYQVWYEYMINNFNIVIHGQESKFRVIETFSSRYLTSGRLRESIISKDHRNKLNVRLVKLHGLMPIPTEKFLHALFKITTNQRNIDDEIKNFLDEIKKNKTHHFFLMHSFELLYKRCRRICDIIFDMCQEDRDYIHIVMSLDHINGAKLLHGIKFKLNLVSFFLHGGESFFLEKTQTVCLMAEDGEVGDEFLDTQTSLQSLLDIYQALQKNLKSIMVYILTHCVEKDQEARDSSKRARVNQNLEIAKLLDYCTSKFIVRREARLRNYLGELVDHNIIQLPETGKQIKCLVTVETCKKFIENVTKDQ